MEKLLDAAFVTNFKLQQMERMVSGGLGLQLKMAQQQSKAGMLVPQSISLLPAPCALDNVKQHEPMTAAAKQRHMAEQRWQANKLSEEASLAGLTSCVNSRPLAGRPEVPEGSNDMRRPAHCNGSSRVRQAEQQLKWQIQDPLCKDRRSSRQQHPLQIRMFTGQHTFLTLLFLAMIRSCGHTGQGAIKI